MMSVKGNRIDLS